MSIKVGRLGSCSRGEGDLTELDPTELDLTELDSTVEVEEELSSFLRLSLLGRFLTKFAFFPGIGRRFGVEVFKKYRLI